MTAARDELNDRIAISRERTLAFARELVACAANHHYPLHWQVIAGSYCHANLSYGACVHHFNKLAPLSTQLDWIEAIAPCCAVLSLVGVEFGQLHDIDSGTPSDAYFLHVRDASGKPESFMREVVRDGMVGEWHSVTRESLMAPLITTAFQLQSLRIHELKTHPSKR